jgi:hypothetical protein
VRELALAGVETELEPSLLVCAPDNASFFSVREIEERVRRSSQTTEAKFFWR